MADEEWFETIEIGGKLVPHVSKFLRKNFSVSRESIEQQWRSWTNRRKLEFAGAFSAKGELNDDDQSVLDFIMENGDATVWRTIALSVVKHRDRDRALVFLLDRVKEGSRPLANYYQALEMLHATESVLNLKEVFSRHLLEIDRHPSLQSWGDRFIYLDYLSCCAALFTLTGEEDYRGNLRKMLQHRDETITKMTRMIAKTSGIAIE